MNVQLQDIGRVGPPGLAAGLAARPELAQLAVDRMAEALQGRLGRPARRTTPACMTHQPIDPKDCAQAIMFLASPLARCTTGHLIPVDGGLTEAYLR